jgi:hypothetical protein
MEEVKKRKSYSLSNEYFLRYGEGRSGRQQFYGIEHYLVYGWQFYPSAYLSVVARSWKILRKFKRIRAKVRVALVLMNGVRGVLIYRASKRFGDESLISALAATKFISGKVTTL